MNERILVIPRTALPAGLPSRGFMPCAVSTAQDLVRYRRFADRDKAEIDPSLKQVIPYLVLRSARLVFRYWRTKRAGESRLRHLYSVGVGGHINERDINLYSSSEREILVEAAMRELREEMNLPGDVSLEFCGLLNDDQTDVGSVHLGVVFVCEVDSSKVEIREKGALSRGEWLPPHMLWDGVLYESWSEILITEWLKPAD